MPIYTKKGDKGKTSLGSGVRVWKNSDRVESYGTIDELNALLGVAVAELSATKKDVDSFWDILLKVQDDLFCVGSYLSNPANANLVSHLSNNTKEFEKSIDKMTNNMPELENFILPGGTRLASILQLARAVSRRAERKIVGLSRQEKVNPDVIQYVNRLSDLFFTMSRFANHTENKKETIWKRR